MPRGRSFGCQRRASGVDVIAPPSVDPEMKHDGELAIHEDVRGLSSLRGVARIEAVVYDQESGWAITAEIPYDGTVLLARCLSQDDAASLVLAITA